MNIGDLNPSHPAHDYASVQPRDGRVGSNQQRRYPQEPERPAPIRPAREVIPPAKRIADIEHELAEALKLANDAQGQYQAAKQLPYPSPRLEKLRAKVQDLQQKLHAAQLELESEEALPTPIQSFIDVALQLESNVQFLAGRPLVALVDYRNRETVLKDGEKSLATEKQAE
jgi:type II secretory pathway component HofQ